MATPPTGPQDNLNNVGFGTLNDMSKPIGGNRERKSGGESFMDAVVNATQNQFSLNAIDNTGPYKAVVLRVDAGAGSGADPAPEAGGWLDALVGAIGNLLPAPPVLVRVKARIPEIHAALPIPMGRGDTEGPHQQVIDMYPTFVAQSADMIAPEIGEIIYVDFGNKNKWTDPVIVTNIVSKKPPPGSGGPGSGDCFKPSSGGGGLSPPSGDALPGANKAATNSGLPLLQRKASEVESGEHKTIKGEKGGYVNTVSAWEKSIQAAKFPGKSWIGYVDGNDTKTMTSWGGDSEHKSEDEVRDTIIFVPNVTDLTFKESEVEIMVYFHDFNEYDLQSFTEIANTIKKMALDGRNFVLIMPELPWSSNTNTPNSRTDDGMDDYDDWWDEVLEALSSASGAKFEDGAKGIVLSIFAKGAGNYIIRNAAQEDEFHGTCVAGCPDPAHRMVMSFPAGSIPGDALDELIDEWQAEINPNDTECAFLCNYGIVDQIEAEIQDLKNDLDSGHPYNVIVEKYDDSVPLTASALLRWVNFDKAKAKEEEEAEAAKKAEGTPVNDETSADADMAEKNIPPEEPPKQPDAQAPPPQDPPTPPSETPKKSATGGGSSSAKLGEAVVWQENRVKVKDFGSLVGAAADALLVSVPKDWTTGSKTRKLHKLAMDRVKAIHDKAKESGINLFVASAWREHKWKSYDDYVKKVTAEYGTLKEGKKKRAFNSPHETGLAVDWGKPSGLEPVSATISAQKKTIAYAWLQQNAHLFGLTPYKEEPWHWEIKLTKEAWVTGEEFVNTGEAPASYAVRVGDLGATDAQLPSGPSSGGTGGGGGGGGASCRRRSGGGGGGGPYGPAGPGVAFSGVGSPGAVKLVAGPAMPAARYAPGGKGMPKRKGQIKIYIIHETAGWPTETGEKYAKKLAGTYYPGGEKQNSLVTYWTAHNGDIVQTAPFASQCWSATPVNKFSQGNEMGNRVRINANPKKNYVPTRASSTIIKKGQIIIRQDNLGHVRTLAGYEGAGTYRGGANGAFMLNSQAQVEAVWKHIVWMSSGADGMEGSEWISLPIAFPAVMSDDYFCWSRTPMGMGKHTGEWWKEQSAKEDWAGGIAAHNNWHHGDGAFGEYYCLGRAKGLSSDDAYYTAVGALCSMAGKGHDHTGHGKKTTRHPDSEYTQMGRDIMREAPLTHKWGSLTADSYWGWG